MPGSSMHSGVDGKLFDAWAISGPLCERVTAVGVERIDDSVVRRISLSPAEVSLLTAALREAGTLLRLKPISEIARTLGRVGARFGDPSDPLRMRALSALPATSGLSPEMSEYVLDGMCRDWSTDVFVELLEREFGEVSRLDAPDFAADPPRLTTHIGSGTVPGVTATSLIRSLLVKSPALAKPGLGDVVLPVLWAQAIQEADSVLGNALSVVYWPGGSEAIDRAAVQAADQVVVYGSDRTISEIRSRADSSQRLIAYSHRVGVGVLGRESLAAEQLKGLAGEVALAVATFDQRGCVSPHVIYVEEGGESNCSGFAAALAVELSDLERTLPSGHRSPDEALAFQHLKGTQEMRAAAGQGVEVYTRPGEPWTVVVDPDPAFAPSCLGRFIWIKPVGDLAELPALLKPASPYLQTIALAVDERRGNDLAKGLVGLGVSRIETFRETPWPRAWWRNDGHGPLRVLMGLESES